MLRRAGLLGDDDIARVEAICRARAVGEVAAFSELGLVPEAQLVRFLHSKLMIPIVEADVLDRLQPDTLARVPASLAWEHTVIPVSMDADGNLTLAMADPTDLAAVEAVSAHSRSYLIRAVAPLSALRQALARHYGPPRESVVKPMGSAVRARLPQLDLTPTSGGHDLATQVSTPVTSSDSASPDRIPPTRPRRGAVGAGPARGMTWTPGGFVSPQSNPSSVSSVPAPIPARVPTAPHRAEYPLRYGDIDQMTAPTEANHRPPSSPLPSALPNPLDLAAVEAIVSQLEAAADRDAITNLVMDFIGSGFERVILFVHVHHQLRGRDARGKDLVADAVGQVRIPTKSGSSMFADVIDQRKPYWGAWPTRRAIDRAFGDAMGGIAGNVLMLPIGLGEYVPLVLFGMGPQQGIEPSAFERLSDGTTRALEQLVVRRRSSGPR